MKVWKSNPYFSSSFIFKLGDKKAGSDFLYWKLNSSPYQSVEPLSLLAYFIPPLSETTKNHNLAVGSRLRIGFLTELSSEESCLLFLTFMPPSSSFLELLLHFLQFLFLGVFSHLLGDFHSDLWFSSRWRIADSVSYQPRSESVARRTRKAGRADLGPELQIQLPRTASTRRSRTGPIHTWIKTSRGRSGRCWSVCSWMRLTNSLVLFTLYPGISIFLGSWLRYPFPFLQSQRGAKVLDWG